MRFLGTCLGIVISQLFCEDLSIRMREKLPIGFSQNLTLLFSLDRLLFVEKIILLSEFL